MIETDYPQEAAYLQDESILVHHEKELQQKLYDFCKTTGAMTGQRNYPDIVDFLRTTSEELIAQQHDFHTRCIEFHRNHVVPEIFQRIL